MTTPPRAIRFRLLLAFIFSAALAYWSLDLAVEGVQAGAITVTVSKAGYTATYTQVQSPLPYYFWVSFHFTAGALGLGLALFFAGAVLRQRDAKWRDASVQYLTGIEEDAPSGMKPLWIGLLVAVGVFLIYVLAA